MKIRIAFAALVMLLIGNIAQAEKWYDGGTLQKSNVSQYLKGSERDQLATAFDWVGETVSEQAAQGLSQETIFEGCAAIRKCVKTSTTGIEAMQNSAALDIALMCMAQLKGQYPWMLTKK